MVGALGWGSHITLEAWPAYYREVSRELRLLPTAERGGRVITDKQEDGVYVIQLDQGNWLR